MSFLPDCSTIEIPQFNGIWLPAAQQGVDDTKIPLDHGRAGKNVQYFGDSVGTRFGHSSMFTPGGPVSSAVNWNFVYGTPATQHNYLVWFTPGVGVQFADLASPSVVTTAIAQTTAANAFIMPSGSRLYIAFVDANGLGMAQGQVYGFGVGADPLFAAPMTTTMTVSELGSGLTTVGVKLLGYLIQTRNGYITRPSPQGGSTFAPVSWTSTGGTIILSVDPPGHVWPAYASMVAPIMSTTANPNQFFIVPSLWQGSSPFFSINHSGPTLMFVSVADSYLTSVGLDATPYLLQLGQTTSGTAPIEPNVIFSYGSRVGYQCLDSAGVPVAYISDPGLPQSINAANSAVYLPGNLAQTGAFPLRQTLYLEGPHWTFSVTDSGGTPSTWASPQLVDGAIGALGSQCMTLNASENYAWVADEAGLYLFTGGSFPQRPVSYYQQTDWIRINFAAANRIQVVDDKTNSRVHVLAPLDGATTPTHILSWDYSLGPEAEQVKYGGACNLSQYDIGAIMLVQNPTTKHVEKWVAPGRTGQPFGRENNGTDQYPFRDFASGIDSIYETALVPQGLAGRLIMHHGAQMRIRGNGTAKLTVFPLDHTNLPSPPPPAQGNPLGPFKVPGFGSLADGGQEIFQRFFMINEYASLQFESDGALDSWFQLSRVDHYYTHGSPSR